MTLQSDVVIKKLKDEITTLKEKLNLSNAAFLNIVNKNKDGILIIDNAGVIVYVNPAAVNLFGRNMGELLGENIGIFINPDKTTEITVVHKSEGLLHIEVSITDTFWENQPVKLANLHDVTAHNNLEKLLKHLSHYDFLTDLANRVYFEDKLKMHIMHMENDHKRFALLYLDLDGFKNVNDQFGHHIGDLLLVQVAKILKGSVRSDDTVARLGGDEFAIIIDRVKKIEDVEQIAQKLLKIISEPIKCGQHQVHVNFSIGIALYPDNGITYDELIKNSDNAMYLAKKSGPGQYYFSTNKVS